MTTAKELKERRRAERERLEREWESNYIRLRNSIESMLIDRHHLLDTPFFVLVFSIVGIVLLVVTLTVIFSLPQKGLKEYELDFNNSERIIAHRAMKYLEKMSNFGPKPIGSYENEYLTAEYIKYILEKIKKEAPIAWNGIDIDIQVVSGSYSIVTNNGNSNFQKQISYQNLQNIVAKLYSKQNVTESILVNCHFDSVFGSPGTSDDNLNCAVMLEVLHVMSKVDHSLKRNVIFLFNGGEEDGKMASHGFITKHKWFNEIITFVNLEAYGAGGRQILFHSGLNGAILPKIYSKSVPYPTGVVIGEELYQIGVLPSDTDFTNFNKYGNLKGLDFANTGNGYVYHTSNDNISMINEDVIQFAGDNIIPLIQALVDYDSLKEELQFDDPATYYDIFGELMFSYSSTVDFLVNLIAVFISLYSSVSLLRHIAKDKPIKPIFVHVLIDLGFVIIGILAVTLALYLLAALLKISDCTMIWYSRQWFVFTYYVAAVLLVMSTVIKIRNTFIRSLLDVEQEAKVFILAIQFIMTVILLLGTLKGIRSSFILIIGLIGVSISHYFLNKTRLRYEIAERKFIAYVAINFVPALYSVYVFIPYFQIIIPMMGRMGADYDVEYTIWILTEIAVLISCVYFIPLVLLVKEFWTMQYLFMAIYVAQVLTIITGSISPYNDSAPQRFHVMHVNRKLAKAEYTFKNESSGYLLTPFDTHGAENIMELFNEHDFLQLADSNICTEELFCGMPNLHTANLVRQHLSFWTSKEVPKIPTVKRMNYSTENVENEMTIYLNLNGSKFMDMIILPLNGAQLIEWSFDPSKPGNKLKWNDQVVYLIRYHEGSLNHNSLSFSLKFDVSRMDQKNVPVFKLAWSVFYPTNNTDSFTPQFNQFIDEFPPWISVTPMVVEYEEYLLPDL